MTPRSRLEGLAGNASHFALWLVARRADRAHTDEIDFELPIGITRMVLVPSIVIRPWSMVNETGSTW